MTVCCCDREGRVKRVRRDSDPRGNSRKSRRTKDCARKELQKRNAVTNLGQSFVLSGFFDCDLVRPSRVKTAYHPRRR